MKRSVLEGNAKQSLKARAHVTRRRNQAAVITARA